MDNNSLVAVATTDEIVVNSHFGKATHFQIFKVNMDEFSYEEVGKIDVEPICQNGDHNEDELTKRIEVFSEYDFIIVSRVGPGARNEIEKNGIEIYEIPGVIEESLQKLYTHIQIQKLFL